MPGPFDSASRQEQQPTGPGTPQTPVAPLSAAAVSQRSQRGQVYGPPFAPSAPWSPQQQQGVPGSTDNLPHQEYSQPYQPQVYPPSGSISSPISNSTTAYNSPQMMGTLDSHQSFDYGSLNAHQLRDGPSMFGGDMGDAGTGDGDHLPLTGTQYQSSSQSSHRNNVRYQSLQYAEPNAAQGPYGQEDTLASQKSGPAYSFLERPPSVASTEGAFRRRQTAVVRGKTVQVKLRKGHFVHEFPVPSAVHGAVEPQYLNGSTEFSHMRYTAATCDPDDFTVENGWETRPYLYKRETELLIAITSYNEDKELYARSLHATMDNIRAICKSQYSSYWRNHAETGNPPWQRIVVALIVDGIDAMDKSVLDLLATIGLFQDQVLRKKVDEKETTAHIFEYTTALSVDFSRKEAMRLITPDKDDEKKEELVPVQFILVLKQKNEKKINSHRWLFNALGRQLKPEICILLDAGTKPDHKAFYHLWREFRNNPNTGGACGEIHAMLNRGRKLINPLVAAQNFEYKISNILDKPLESSFGFVSVLPGAFSAYRYAAIQGAPLEAYFEGDHSLANRLEKLGRGINCMSIWTKNMYLAEDRILCFEIVACKGKKWVLRYVKEAIAETDVPEQAGELISQRRRWLNGSTAASIYAIVHYHKMWRSSHNIIRQLFFLIQFVYNVYSFVFSYFSLAAMYLTFSIIIQLLPHQSIWIFGGSAIGKAAVYWVNFVLICAYIACLALSIILALGNKPKYEQKSYIFIMLVFALCAYYMTGCAVVLTIKSVSTFVNDLRNPGDQSEFQIIFNSNNLVILAAIASTLGMYFVASFMYFDAWHMFHSFIQYVGLAPTFINVLMVYAFSNLHDVSWGTKGSTTVDALPAISSDKKGEVEVIEKEQATTDQQFYETVKRTVHTEKHAPKVEREKTPQSDQDKIFRTRFVATWLGLNALVVALIVFSGSMNGDMKLLLINEGVPPGTQTLEGITGNVTEITSNVTQEALNVTLALTKKQSIYFTIILYSTAGLALIKFSGFLYYFFTVQLNFWRKR